MSKLNTPIPNIPAWYDRDKQEYHGSPTAFDVYRAISVYARMHKGRRPSTAQLIAFFRAHPELSLLVTNCPPTSTMLALM